MNGFGEKALEKRKGVRILSKTLNTSQDIAIHPFLNAFEYILGI